MCPVGKSRHFFGSWRGGRGLVAALPILFWQPLASASLVANVAAKFHWQPQDGEAPQAVDTDSLEKALIVSEAKVRSKVLQPANLQAAQAETGALVVDAQGQRAVAAAMEARAAGAEATSANGLAKSRQSLVAAKARADLATKASAMISASALKAAIYARSAMKAAEKAKLEVQEIAFVPQEAAAEAAQAAIADFEKKIKKWNSEQFTVAPTVLPDDLAAARAAAPYYEAMQRATDTRVGYGNRARELEALAESLQQGAQSLSAQAMYENDRGNREEAKDMLAKAKDMLSRADIAKKEAGQIFEQVKHINDQMPMYQANAAIAAGRASVLAGSHWLPPPPLAAGGPAAAPAGAPGAAPGR